MLPWLTTANPLLGLRLVALQQQAAHRAADSQDDASAINARHVCRHVALSPRHVVLSPKQKEVSKTRETSPKLALKLLPNTRWMVVVTTSPTSLCLQPIKAHTCIAKQWKGRQQHTPPGRCASPMPCAWQHRPRAEACLGRFAALRCMRCSANSMHIAHSMQTQAQRDATLTWVRRRPRAPRPLTSGSQPPRHQPPPARLQCSRNRRPTNEWRAVCGQTANAGCTCGWKCSTSRALGARQLLQHGEADRGASRGTANTAEGTRKQPTSSWRRRDTSSWCTILPVKGLPLFSQGTAASKSGRGQGMLTARIAALEHQRA